MHRYLRGFIASLIIIAGALTECPAQVWDNFESFPRAKDTLNLNFHESVNYLKGNYFKKHDLLLKLSYNSAYPRGFNDGPVWKGKGLTLESQGGFSGKKGRLSYTLFPIIFFSQNASYLQSPIIRTDVSRNAYQFVPDGRNIDWVQRFGDSPFFRFHPGQSEVKMKWGKVITSISTQNYSAGPATHNPIVLGRQGVGFPHLRIGSEPFDLTIRKLETGKWELNFLYGLLSESDYFDANSENDQRYFNGMFIAYQPKFLPQMTVAFNRALYKNTQFFEPWDLLSTIHIFDSGTRGDSINTNDTFDQLASLSFTWDLPKSGFRAYLEFARNDFSGKLIRFLKEPEHSRAYTIGFEKSVNTASGKEVIISYEHTNLSRNHTFLYQPEPTYYAHHINRQGYTHEGQLLGAGIGPGGNSGHLNVRIVKKDQTIGFLFERIEYNKDYFVVHIQDRERHNIEYSLGFNMQRETESVSYGFESILSYNFNRYYIHSDLNLYLALSTRIKLNK